jgi:hypothetical protein
MGLEEDARARATVNAHQEAAAERRRAEASSAAAAERSADAQRLAELVAEFIASCQGRRVAMGDLYPADVYGGYLSPYEAAGVALTGPTVGAGWAFAVETFPGGPRAMAVLADGRLAHCCASTGLVSSKRENRKFRFRSGPNQGSAFVLEDPWRPGTKDFGLPYLSALREAMVGYLAEKS